MTLDELAPFKIYINLKARTDRREKLEHVFKELGIEAQRLEAVPADKVKSTYGYRSKARYACSLSKRMAIAQAARAGAPSMLLMEDDLVFAPDFHAKLEALTFPDNWQVIFLGCRHVQEPFFRGQGICKVTQAVDNHAMIIRASAYRDVIFGLAGCSQRNATWTKHGASDWKLSKYMMSGFKGVYACDPNLVWQGKNHSDNIGTVTCNYTPDGKQTKQDW